MKVKSPSKLNLHLEVIKKRDDGYHDLRSAIQLIDFHDVMELIALHILKQSLINI